MKIGFIGGGNMGGAIIGGIINAGIADKSDIIVSDKNGAALENINKKYGVSTEKDNKNTAQRSDMLFLCVKPQFLSSVTDEIKDNIKEGSVIVSIVAGKSLCALGAALGADKKIIRVMPNTPALVGEGMAALVPNENVSEDETGEVIRVFSSFGKCERVTENLMDAVTAVSGSSPAYVFILIEAMADAAVAGGMARDKAYTFAAQAVLGSAKMVIDTGKHPGELKDMVCSPAGTTIDAVAALEKNGFRNAVIEAMRACMEKSNRLGNE